MAVEYWFRDDTRAEALFREGRLKALNFGWNITATWRIPCDHCGTDFEAGTTAARYCSDGCKLLGQREKGRARVAKHRANRRTEKTDMIRLHVIGRFGNVFSGKLWARDDDGNAWSGEHRPQSPEDYFKPECEVALTDMVWRKASPSKAPRSFHAYQEAQDVIEIARP